MTTVAEIEERRLNAFRDGGRAAMIEAMTVEDIRVIHEALRALPEDARLVANVYADLEREFAKGDRCAVCGRTSKQNAAIGYDCSRGC